MFQMPPCCSSVNRVIGRLRSNSTTAIPCLFEQLGNLACGPGPLPSSIRLPACNPFHSRIGARIEQELHRFGMSFAHREMHGRGVYQYSAPPSCGFRVSSRRSAATSPSAEAARVSHTTWLSPDSRASGLIIAAEVEPAIDSTCLRECVPRIESVFLRDRRAARPGRRPRSGWRRSSSLA